MTAETSNARGEWVLVPREPTEAMLDAMHSRIRILCDPAARTADIQNDREVWDAMLAVSPPAPISVPLDRLTALDGLVDRIAEAIRDGDGLAEGDPPWERLGEERRAPWRADAMRVLAVVKESLTAETRTPPPADAEPKTLPVPTRVYLTDKAAVIVGDPQCGWDEDAQDAHNCDAMGCASIGPHVLARVPFTDGRALSQKPEAQAQDGGEVYMEVTVRDGAWVGTYAEWCRRKRNAPPSAPVGVEGGINIPAAKALIEIVGPGFKVIYRDAFRWKDASGNVLPNHYEMFSAETLARDFGYDLVLDLGYAAILRDPSALATQPAAKPDAVAGLVEKAHAGCTIWRGSLRVSVTETEAIEYRIDADEAFCDLAQRALDSLAAAWDAAALATKHQEPTT